MESQTNPGSDSNNVFNVHWDDFNRVVVDSLWSLLAEESLTDCTLVVSPTEQVQVHRVVLSANSPYFRSLLQSHSQHPHPIIILQDVSYSTLKMLVTFMYRGHVSVTSDEMNTLLKAADHLQIIGLTQTRRSPINFVPSIVPVVSIPVEPPSGEPAQVYSKKAWILDKNKTATNTTTTPTSATSSSTSFRDHRDYEMDVEHGGPLEQKSPLSLKKEDEPESTDWEDKQHMEHVPQEQSALCLRYCCPYCSTNFPSQSSLSRHIMMLHPTVYSSAMYEQGPSSSQAALINSPEEEAPPVTPTSPPTDHNHLESSDDPTDGSAGIICKFCGKPFPEVSQLIQHLPIHTGERPFKCEFCGKAFKLRHHMKDHARVHTGERPFRCSLCGKTFSRSTILKAHEKTHFPKGVGGGP
jgi:hypothetical protein